MFDIGFWEIFLILVLALIVIGPERLPGAARKAGYWVGRARRYIEGVRNDVESQMDLGEFKRLLHNQEVQINELQQKLKVETTKLTEIESGLDEDILTEVDSHKLKTEDSFSHEDIDEWEQDTLSVADNAADNQPSVSVSTDDSSVQATVEDRDKPAS